MEQVKIKDFFYKTDNDEQQVALGKQIVTLKKEIYTNKMVEAIYKDIKKHVANNEELSYLDNLFYRSVYHYWAYGANVGECFFYDFFQKKDIEKREYLTCKNRFEYMYFLNKKEDAHLLDNKYETYCKLKQYYLRDVIKIAGEEDYDQFLNFVKKHRKFVAKPESLGLGRGVHLVELEEGNEKEFFENLLQEGRQIILDTSWAKDRSPSVVLEEVIEEKEEMSVLHPCSVNPIRCTTVRVGNEVKLFYPRTKVGCGNDFVVNAACGGKVALIDEKTGIIYTDWYSEYGDQCEKHPATGIKAKGFQIPEWDKMVKLAKDAARDFDTIRYIGWDLVYSKKGWCILEGNFAGEFMAQIPIGHGQKREFENLIGWAPQKEFWWE